MRRTPYTVLLTADEAARCRVAAGPRGFSGWARLRLLDAAPLHVLLDTADARLDDPPVPRDQRPFVEDANGRYVPNPAWSPKG